MILGEICTTGKRRFKMKSIMKSITLILLAMLLQQLAPIRALSQTVGTVKVSRYDPDPIVMFKDGKITYPSNWGPVYLDDGERCEGYVVSNQGDKQTLVDIKRNEIYTYFKTFADGHSEVYDKDGNILCQMDPNGYIRNTGSDTVVGLITNGIVRTYNDKYNYDEVLYEDFPVEYLFALWFPNVYICREVE